MRVEELLTRHLSTVDGVPREVWSWTITQGCKKLSPNDSTGLVEKKAPNVILTHIAEYSKTVVKVGKQNDLVRSVFILKDFGPYLKSDPVLQRMLKDLSISLEDKKTSVIILDPVKEVPAHLEGGRITVVDFELPDITEIKQMANDCLEAAGTTNTFSPDYFNQICEACLGMTALQIYGVLSRSIVEKGTLDPRFILTEKKMVIQQTGLLQYFEPTLDLGDVGGLAGLKDWVVKRKAAFTIDARLYGLPHPKGVILLGIAGSGKSLVAKSLGAEFGLPLLRLDMGRVFAGIVGSSEANIRKVLEIAESLAPCILFIDELEKGVSGSQSSGVSDGGTTARVFGTFLTWLADKEKPVFVVATCNDITQMPPELLRKGRFDDLFFLDLPNREEREEIFKIHIKKRKRDPDSYDIPSLLGASEGWSGAEIEQAVISAMYDAFSAPRELGMGAPEFSTQDILENLLNTMPLSKTKAPELEKMREWAKNRARLASTIPETKTAVLTRGRRNVDRKALS